MIYYRSNFDFEEQLLKKNHIKKPDFSSDRKNYEFEYLFFFLDLEGILNTPIQYDLSFLGNLVKYFGLNPACENNPQSKYEYWWGDLDNFKKSQMLNDKVFFWEFCEKNNIPYPRSIKDIRDINKIKSSEVIIRKRLSFSGIGSQIKKVNKLIDINKDVIVSEYKEKCQDFGLIVEKDIFYIYKTIIDKNNQFKGVESYDSTHLIDHVFDFVPSIRKLDIYANYPFQIDGFLSGKKVFFHELNYRNSLGQVFSYIIRRYFPDRSGRILLEPYQIYLNKNFDFRDLIPLTPLDGEFSYRFGLTLELKHKN